MKDPMFEELIAGKLHVTVFLANGVQMHGVFLKEYENYVVFQEDMPSNPGGLTRINKRVISTIKDSIPKGVF